MGGATIVAIKIGKEDKDGANKAFMAALILTLIVSVILTVVGMVFCKQIVDISGASKLSETMREMSAQYLFYYSAFSIPMLMSSCLAVFVRNDGSPALSFGGMCAGAIANIFLDWLFIFPLDKGIIGTAVASGLGQVFSLIILLTHFIRKKGLLRIKFCKTDISLIKNICRRGIPEAVTQLTTPVTALCYNLMLARLIGDIGVSTFSILSFIYSLANAILSGGAQGLQPLWGNCFGRRDEEQMNWYFKSGIMINIVLSVLIFAALYIFDVPIIRIFNKETELIQTAAKALPLFSLSFIPMAVNLIFTAFFYSTQRTGTSNMIAISRGIVMKALAVFAMPIIFETEAIWVAPLAAETLTLFICIWLNRKRG